MFVDGLDGFQHVLPVQLSLQWIDRGAFLQPPVQIQVSALHQHVYVAAGYLTAMIFLTITFSLCVVMFYKEWTAILTSQTAWWSGHCVAASGLDVGFHSYNFLLTDHQPPKGRHILKQRVVFVDPRPGRPELAMGIKNKQKYIKHEQYIKHWYFVNK